MCRISAPAVTPTFFFSGFSHISLPLCLVQYNSSHFICQSVWCNCNKYVKLKYMNITDSRETPTKVQIPPLTPYFPYSYMSLSTWFSVFFPGTGASTILLSMCSLCLLLTCPYHSILFSVIFVVTGAILLLILSHVRF